ncbi:MAG: hypothetical protein OEW39_13175 [Deltaproteobacteria bacterium]|nr:hypothetical protein [Deltaproteobacteria bacterium]
MLVSSFQMERVLHRLARWIGWPRGSAPRGGDPVTKSAGVLLRAPGKIPPRLKHGPITPKRMGGRHPAVLEEVERRAGSFMEPPYPPSPRPSHVPRLKAKAGKTGQKD